MGIIGRFSRFLNGETNLTVDGNHFGNAALNLAVAFPAAPFGHFGTFGSNASKKSRQSRLEKQLPESAPGLEKASESGMPYFNSFLHPKNKQWI
jgi:hypothetical protein